MISFDRRYWFAGLAVVTTLLPHESHAQAKPTHAGSLELAVLSESGGPNLLRPVLATGDEEDWVTEADYAAEAIAKGVPGFSIVKVMIDIRGEITGCAPISGTGDELLEQLACDIVRRRGRFRYALAADGSPLASTIRVRLRLQPDGVSSPPPPPPILPPRGGFRDDPGIRLIKKPDWSRFAPAEKPSGEVEVSVNVHPASYGLGELRTCHVVSSSENNALDRATCEAVKSANYEQVQTARYWLPMRMLVRWRRGKAEFELPNSEKRRRLAIAGGDAAAHALAAPGLVTERGWAHLTFNPGKKIDCWIGKSTGSDQSDVALCTALRTQLKYAPERDDFGREVRATRMFDFNP